MSVDQGGRRRHGVAAPQGRQDLIAKFSPSLYVENDRADRSAELIRFIDSLGYAMFWHRPPLFNPQNFLKHPENVFGNIVSINMLCVPKTPEAQLPACRRSKSPLLSPLKGKICSTSPTINSP